MILTQQKRNLANFVCFEQKNLVIRREKNPVKYKMQGTSATVPMSLPQHNTYLGNDGVTTFKTEFGHSSELPQYFYNGYNQGNWYPDGQQPVNTAEMQPTPPQPKLQQFDNEFNALKRQFNEPMFVINDSPEIRQLSQYLSEGYTIEKRNGQYKCPLCDKLFNGSALARRHVYTHSVDKVFACAACGRKFSHARHLRDHIKIKHGNPANLPDRSNRHRSSYTTPLASRGEHFMSMVDNHSARLNCHAFQHEFDTLRALYKDNKSIVVNDLPEIREISQYLMPNYEFSKVNDQVMCPLCDGLFNSKSTVRRHLTNHLKVKMFRCGECEREFRHARHLGEHIRQKHQPNFQHANDAEYSQPNRATNKGKGSTMTGNGNGHHGVGVAGPSNNSKEVQLKFECLRCHAPYKRRKKTNDGYCNACYKYITKYAVNGVDIAAATGDRLHRHMIKTENQIKLNTSKRR